MSEILTLDPSEYPDISQMVLEDDTPLDSFINEKQQRLLTTVFYSGADTGIHVPFIVAANVGLFTTVRQPGIAPDVFLSLNVEPTAEWWARNVRSYLFWEFGKPPDVVIEIVSPTPGNELGRKLRDYAQMRILYYVVYDPLRQLGEAVLRVFQLQGLTYVPKDDAWFPEVGLGLTLWTGVFEDVNSTWLRWCYQSGEVIATGDENHAQQQTQLSQKDAQLAEQQNQIKQTLLASIEMGLKLKFGDDGVAMLAEIAAINDANLLKAIFSSFLTVSSLDELRQIYHDFSSN